MSRIQSGLQSQQQQSAVNQPTIESSPDNGLSYAAPEFSLTASAPVQMKAANEFKGEDKPIDPDKTKRKFQKKFSKWKRKNADAIVGLSEAEVFEKFGESKTMMGKQRKAKKWFKNYVKAFGKPQAVADPVEIVEPVVEEPVAEDTTTEIPIEQVEVEAEEPVEEEPALITLANGENLEPGSQAQSSIDEFNTLYQNATANGAEIGTDVWNFQNYLDGETVVGNYLAHYIQELPEVPADYDDPATFALSGVQPTYDAAREYRDPGGNCYSTSSSRINKAYEDLYGVTPIDYTQNANGTFTTEDYKTASSQSGASNFGYGVGGALANGGEADLVTNEEVWAGELKPGAALQIWHSTDTTDLTSGGGHSQIFISYVRNNQGEITGLNVYDNSGEIEVLDREWYEANETILAGNLRDQ